MTIPYNVYAALVAAAVVFALSVTGSFIVWLSDINVGETHNGSQPNRWKWMTTVFLLIMWAMMVAKPQ